jgi:tetratricopeptide (TPR) repeat protein
MFVLFMAATATAQGRDGELDRLSDRARTALAAKNWREAEQALEKLASLAPAVAEVQANLGLALYFEARPADALTAFERARKLNPALPQLDVMTGLCDAELGRYQDAVTLLEPAFRHPPDDETGRLIGLHLAQAHAELQQFDRAFAAGEELLRRYPNDPEILYQVSHLHSDRSYALMSALVRAAPDSAWTHFANAQVQESLSRFEAAEREYRNALARDPHLVGAHYRLGRVMLSAARTTDSIGRARHEFEMELQLSPRNADAEYELGEIEREHGNLDLATGHFARALGYQPQFVEAQVGMAKTLMKQGHPAEAVPHLAEAAKLEPENKIPHYLLSMAYKALGDTAAAQREIALYQKPGAQKPAAAPQPGAHDDALNQP